MATCNAGSLFCVIVDTRQPKSDTSVIGSTGNTEWPLIGFMLDQERNYFAEHLAELLSEHLGKFVVIKDDELIGAFNTIEEALAEGARRFGLKPFLVRQVSAANEKEISIPALTLGLLRADSSRPI